MKTQLQKLSILLAILLISNVANAQWDTITNGIQKQIVSGLKLPDCNDIMVLSGQTLIGATGQGIYKSTDYGDSWTYKILCGAKKIKKGNSGRLFALCSTGPTYIFKSDDNGDNWSAASTSITSIAADLTVSPNGNLYLATTGIGVNGKVFRSTDNGDNWTDVSTGIPSTEAIYSILALDNNTILVGGETGIYLTTNAAAGWASVTGVSDALCLNKHSNGTIYAGTRSGIKKSIDNGSNWSQASFINNTADIYDIEFDNSGFIYLCVYNQSINRYTSTEMFNGVEGSTTSGMMNTRVTNLTIDESGLNPVFFASTEGSIVNYGYFYRKGYISDVGILEIKNNLSFTLFPNPANQSIQIQGIHLNNGAHIKIISIDGKIIKDEMINQSNITISDLNSGMYFLELTDSKDKTGVTKFIKE